MNDKYSDQGQTYAKAQLVEPSECVAREYHTVAVRIEEFAMLLEYLQSKIVRQ